MSTTTARRRVLMLEFNELCPSLLDRWMAAEVLSRAGSDFGRAVRWLFGHGDDPRD